MKIMNRRVLGGLVAAAATTATVLAMSGPAQATNPYTPGGGPAADFRATNLTFTDVDAGATLECEQVNLGGSIVNPGSSRAHSAVAGELDDIEAVNCNNDYFGATSINLTGTWDFFVTGDPTGGLWPVELRDVSANVAAVGCSFTAKGPGGTSGTISGTFNPVTQKFAVTGDNLEVNSAVGSCWIIGVGNGNDVEVAGTWTNVPPAGNSPFSLTH
ncbi:hypothetical protein [Aeromicrobium sp. Leaf350]|uniref:hypothetical protein n=1 Tax=Aeromicrobium sp. Leaf350 TaxID=2876565 RepID=UPI001E44859E|nr:hypothetical protein [Aeromicrobium sp. Leaf350]